LPTTSLRTTAWSAGSAAGRCGSNSTVLVLHLEKRAGVGAHQQGLELGLQLLALLGRGWRH
jgi:hypothetical protein